MAICFVVTGGFCLSACNSEKSQTDTDQATEQLESTKKDFMTRMSLFKSDFGNGMEEGSRIRFGWEAYLSAERYTNRSLYLIDGKYYIFNDDNGELIYSFTEGNEPHDYYAFSANECKILLSDLLACEFAYYNGYLISLKSGEWTSYSMSHLNKGIYFYQTYFNFLFENCYALVYDLDIDTYVCVRNGNHFIHFSAIYTSLDGYVFDEDKGILYEKIHVGYPLEMKRAMISFPSSIADLTIDEDVVFSRNWNLFKNRNLNSITFDNSNISMFLQPIGFTGAQEFVNDIAECAQYLYIKNEISIENDSLLYSKFSKLTISDKDGYTKFVRIDN